MEAPAAPGIDAPASPRGYNLPIVTLHLYRLLTGDFIKTIHRDIWSGIERLEQDLEEGLVTPCLKIDSSRHETHHLYYQLFWKDIELTEGNSLQFYVDEYGMPMEVDIKVYFFEKAKADAQ